MVVHEYMFFAWGAWSKPVRVVRSTEAIA